MRNEAFFLSFLQKGCTCLLICKLNFPGKIKFYSNPGMQRPPGTYVDNYLQQVTMIFFNTPHVRSVFWRFGLQYFINPIGVGKIVLKVGQANQAFEGQYPLREIAGLHSVKSKWEFLLHFFFPIQAHEPYLRTEPTLN